MYDVNFNNNEFTLLSILIYSEQGALDIDTIRFVFLHITPEMILNPLASKLYILLKKLCETEDIQLLGTKPFIYRLKTLSALENDFLVDFIDELEAYWTSVSTLNYWITRVQEQYFSEKFKAAETQKEFEDIIEEKQRYVLETDMVDASFGIDNDLEEYEKEKKSSVFTPFKSVNNVVGSLQGGDMIILAATPGCGKTATMLNMAVGMAKEGKRVDIFSLEMPMSQLRRRMICSMAEIDSAKFRQFTLSVTDKAKYQKCADEIFPKLPIKIFRKQTVGIEYIKAIEMKSDSDIVFIDYLGLIDSFGHKASYEKFSDISRNIKLLAMQSNKPIVALHQLNRNIQERDDKTPRISDLRDSGKIEQDADMIWFVHRPFCFDSKESPEKMKFIVAKNRHGANNKEIDFIFNGMYQQIVEPIYVGGER